MASKKAITQRRCDTTQKRRKMRIKMDVKLDLATLVKRSLTWRGRATAAFSTALPFAAQRPNEAKNTRKRATSNAAGEGATLGALCERPPYPRGHERLRAWL